MDKRTIVGQGQPELEWRTYAGDLHGSRYSQADQIKADNFDRLEVAWRFKTDNLGARPEFNLQATPLVANGILYSTGGTRRAVVALDATTGELRWVYGLDEGQRAQASPRKLSGRGLAYWTDGKEERIVYVAPGYTMVALDAKTGRPVSEFGSNGQVDLRLESDQQIDLVNGDIGLHAAPLIVKNVIVVGAAHSAGMVPKSRQNDKGSVRGYDVRTGKRLWIFHTIPRPGEFGNDTWLNDSWSYTGNTGAWAQMSADEELGLVYVPTEMPTNDGYGGHRPGDNLFADSVLALDVATGKRVWHFQAVHHDIWDYDLPCAPILADITVDGRRIKAIAQPSKQAFLYVLDRTNGRPVWPIEERPAPQGDTPGENYSRTQPVPTKPPAYDRQGIGVDDLIDFTPALRAEAESIVTKYRMGPLFTPPVVSTWTGPRATLMLPHTLGGANWPGGSLDPETNVLYIYSGTDVGVMALVHDPKRSDMDFIQGRAPNPDAAPSGRGPGGRGGGGGGGEEGAGSSLSIRGLSIVKPPYGRISAIDLNKGEIVWQIAHGETADVVRNHPDLKGLSIPRTGRFGRVGTLVTKTLVIAGDPGVFTNQSGVRGAMLRAYDKRSGKEVGAVFMPAPQTGTPMTFTRNGKQYIVVAIGGGTYSSELLALRLPS